MRSILITAALFLILWVLSFWLPQLIEAESNVVLAHQPYQISKPAQKLHDSLLIMDWHSDSLLWNRDLHKRSSIGQVDFPRLREGNVAIQMFTAVTKSPRGQNYAENSSDSDNVTLLAMVQHWPVKTWFSLKQRALFQANKLQEFVGNGGDQLRLVVNQQQLSAALKLRQQQPELIITLLGIEGSHALDGELEAIEDLYLAGYRMIALQHFFDNKLGGSLHGVSKAGLTDFGRKVVTRLQQKNIIVDVAHSSPAVVDDVLAMSEKPLLVSHTGIKGVCASDRNISDVQMQAIAKAGGLIAIGFWQGAVCDFSPQGVVKTLRYAIDLLGENHVALGSDFDGSVSSQFDSSELAVLTATMLQANFSETEIRKVMGENSLRFLQQNLPEN